MYSLRGDSFDTQFNRQFNRHLSFLVNKSNQAENQISTSIKRNQSYASIKMSSGNRRSCLANASKIWVDNPEKNLLEMLLNLHEIVPTSLRHSNKMISYQLNHPSIKISSRKTWLDEFIYVKWSEPICFTGDTILSFYIPLCEWKYWNWFWISKFGTYNLIMFDFFGYFQKLE